MPIRLFFFVVLWFPAATTLAAQESPSFPPSKPYREQLEARGPVHEISLREAIATALTQNLDIEIESYNREVSQANVTGADAYYDPVAVLSASLTSSNLPVTNILQTGDSASQITKSWIVAPGIQQNLPGGGTATLSTTVSRTSTNSDYALINPIFGSSVGLVITQPLWRGFRRTAAERQILIARLGERMDETQFRQKVSYVVEQVINAYWHFVITGENYESQRQRRDVAVAEYEQARKQGTSSLTSQRSEVATQDQNLTQAETQIIQASNALKRQLTRSVMDPVWTENLIPVDRPDASPPGVTLEAAAKTASERRPELAQLRLQIQQSDADIRFDKQETRPAVNLRLELQSAGDAGALHSVPPDLAGTAFIPPAVGGLGTAYKQSLTFQHPSLAAGVEIRVPLRNRYATSQLTSAILGERKLESQLRAAQEDALVDVRNAWESLAAQRSNVEAARLSRQLAEERLADQTAKPASDAQNLEILRARRDLADARVHELQVLVDYQMSKVSLQKAMSTLVDDQQIVLARRK